MVAIQASKPKLSILGNDGKWTEIKGLSSFRIGPPMPDVERWSDLMLISREEWENQGGE